MENLIRNWRKKAHLSQKELAKKLFVTPSTISQYENGKREPSLNTLEQIAKICNQTFTLNLQEGLPMKNWTKEMAKEKIMEYVSENGLFNISNDSLDELFSFDGKIYMTNSIHKNPKKSLIYATTNFFVEEKPLKKAKSLFVLFKGPTDRFSFEDAQFAADYVLNIVGDKTKVVFHMLSSDSLIDQYETTYIAFGYPDDELEEIKLQNEEAVFQNVLEIRNHLIEMDIKQKDMVICGKENYLIKFKEPDVGSKFPICFFDVFTYTDKNNTDYIRFKINTEDKGVQISSVNEKYEKIADVIKILNEKNIKELVNGFTTLI